MTQAYTITAKTFGWDEIAHESKVEPRSKDRLTSASEEVTKTNVRYVQAEITRYLDEGGLLRKKIKKLETNYYRVYEGSVVIGEPPLYCILMAQRPAYFIHSVSDCFLLVDPVRY